MLSAPVRKAPFQCRRMFVFISGCRRISASTPIVPGRCLQDRHNVGLPNGRQWARPSPFAGLRLREVVGSWSFQLGRRAAFQLRAQLSLMIQRWVNVCGERCIITDRNLFLFGSAPRVRGTGLWRAAQAVELAATGSDQLQPDCASARQRIRRFSPAFGNCFYGDNTE